MHSVRPVPCERLSAAVPYYARLKAHQNDNLKASQQNADGGTVGWRRAT